MTEGWPVGKILFSVHIVSAVLALFKAGHASVIRSRPLIFVIDCVPWSLHSFAKKMREVSDIRASLLVSSLPPGIDYFILDGSAG